MCMEMCDVIIPVSVWGYYKCVGPSTQLGFQISFLVELILELVTQSIKSTVCVDVISIFGTQTVKVEQYGLVGSCQCEQ